MKHKRQITSDGKIIDIYDNIFSSAMKSYHEGFLLESKYTLGSGSNNKLHKTFFQVIFSKEDFENFKFENEFLSHRLKKYELDKCWAIASSPLSTYYFHIDDHDEHNLTLLYYANRQWNRDWGGETLFANDDGECELAVEYKPGRVVIFDSTIEHKPGSIAMEADEFRFVFVVHFKLKPNMIP